MLKIILLGGFGIVPAMGISFGIPMVFSKNKLFIALGPIFMVCGLACTLWNLFAVNFAFSDGFTGLFLILMFLCTFWSFWNGYLIRKRYPTSEKSMPIITSIAFNFILVFLCSWYLYLWPWGWAPIYHFFEFFGIELP
jgi:hypothetical protein